LDGKKAVVWDFIEQMTVLIGWQEGSSLGFH